MKYCMVALLFVLVVELSQSARIWAKRIQSTQQRSYQVAGIDK
jgi:hypothetical protein